MASNPGDDPRPPSDGKSEGNEDHQNQDEEINIQEMLEEWQEAELDQVQEEAARRARDLLGPRQGRNRPSGLTYKKSGKPRKHRKPRSKSAPESRKVVKKSEFASRRCVSTSFLIPRLVGANSSLSSTKGGNQGNDSKSDSKEDEKDETDKEKEFEDFLEALPPGFPFDDDHHPGGGNPPDDDAGGMGGGGEIAV